MAYDPTLYLGAAEHYTRGRPPYSLELASTLERELGLDGTGRLIDVGCGPGKVALELAHRYDEVVGVDPDPGMLQEAARRADELAVGHARWIQARGEELADLGLAPARTVTFGTSWHWMDRESVADAVHDLLEPGGSMVVIAHQVHGRPRPEGPGPPIIPHADVHALIRRYLGDRRRGGRGFVTPPEDTYEDVFARTRFGGSRTVWAPGRPDLVRDVDGVISGFLSMSFSAPHLYGDRLEAFVADLRALLAERSPDGRFWDWPGDTEIVVATKRDRAADVRRVAPSDQPGGRPGR